MKVHEMVSLVSLFSAVIIGTQVASSLSQPLIPGRKTDVTTEDESKVQLASQYILDTMKSTVEDADGCTNDTSIEILETMKQVFSGTVYHITYTTFYAPTCDKGGVTESSSTQPPEPWETRCSASVWFKPDNSYDFVEGREPMCTP